MQPTIEEIARAFSTHHFDMATPLLGDDVTWTLVGGAQLRGRAAVVALCEESAAELAGVTTEFRQLRTVVTEDCVVVDSVADYTEPTGDRSSVASCDIFDFTEGKVTRIRSFNIELSHD